MKNFYLRKLLHVGLLLIIISSCNFFEEIGDDCEYSIYIINNSGHHIGSYFATGGEFGTYYPDSLPYTSKNVCYDTSVDSTLPDYVICMPLKRFFKQLPHDTLSVFIFHTDTLNKYSWEKIRDDYKVLKRYDLSQNDLRRMNFKIIFP